MFNSKREGLSKNVVGAGETLFDFLKKKKKMSLENSIKMSRIETMELSFSNVEAKQDQLQETERTHNKTERRYVSSNTTPRKVMFIEPEQKKQTTARTFIDIISPFKGRRSHIYELDISMAQENKIKFKETTSGKKISAEQTFTRRQLNKYIQIIKDTILNFIKVGNNLKQKSHCLFIELGPVLKIAEEASENRQIKKKIEQAKDRLRLMEHQFGELQIENANDIVQAFQKTLSEHLISFEAKCRSKFQKAEMEEITKIKSENNSKVEELELINKDLTNTIANCGKKIQRLEKALQESKEQQNYKANSQKKRGGQVVANLQQELKRILQLNEQLLAKISQIEKEGVEKDKKLKDAIYAKDVTQRRLMQEVANAKCTRQEFLLNELSILKQEFQSDMKQLTELYICKEKEQLIVIEDQKREIRQLRELFQSNKQNEKKIDNDAETIKALVGKYRKQNECLVSDMHRMNEELYQHWSALKDIKTLASRLGVLPKFSKIYEDLAFNDLLFS